VERIYNSTNISKLNRTYTKQPTWCRNISSHDNEARGSHRYSNITDSRLTRGPLIRVVSHTTLLRNKISKDTSIERSRSTSGQQVPCVRNHSSISKRRVVYEIVRVRAYRVSNLPLSPQRSTSTAQNFILERKTGTGSLIVHSHGSPRMADAGRFLDPFLPAKHAKNGSAAGLGCQMSRPSQ
jgi:hypothetical protein